MLGANVPGCTRSKEELLKQAKHITGLENPDAHPHSYWLG